MATPQIIWAILAAVLVGALIPVFIGLAVALFRAAREISAVGKQMKPALAKIQTISDRVEILSRGFQDGDKNIADVLASVGTLARCLDGNMKAINISSAIIAAVGPAVAAFVGAMCKADNTETSEIENDHMHAGDDKQPSSSPGVMESNQKPVAAN